MSYNWVVRLASSDVVIDLAYGAASRRPMRGGRICILSPLRIERCDVGGFEWWAVQKEAID